VVAFTHIVAFLFRAYYESNYCSSIRVVEGNIQEKMECKTNANIYVGFSGQVVAII
jgi:hypothetical protein